jgi:hypothetical protein
MQNLVGPLSLHTVAMVSGTPVMLHQMRQLGHGKLNVVENNPSAGMMMAARQSFVMLARPRATMT